MANRWQMNRMGFIGFWKYDDETFQFSDGRLLLRGANASGKSITTQSMIPFILDGDRSPGRLDPFGSADRKMEYYFLGNDEKDDATGYLFLEFKKEGIEQYRTIGIGQRAQKGKPMDFWGFIVLDNRRVGKDFQLYKKVGSAIIPHTRQVLKNLLGENNRLVTKQSEYMELVNKYLFAFPRIEQYAQFIQLMIKVRSPKLSRDFKPSKIYDILNDSLQTLSDVDLRPMVEAMEKMDEIQANLESMRDAHKALQALKKEYEKYTAYILAQKGRSLLQFHEAAVDLEKEISQLRQDLLTHRQEQVRKEQDNEEMKVEEKTLLQEKDLLHMDNIQDSMDRLARQKDTLAEEQQRSDSVRRKLTTYEDMIRQCNTQIHRLAEDIAAEEKRIQIQIERLTDLNVEIHFDKHTALCQVLPGHANTTNGDGRVRSNMINDSQTTLQQLSRQIQDGLTALRDAARLRAEVSRQEEYLDRVTIQRDEQQEELNKAQRLEDDSRDQLIEAFSMLPEQLRELPFTAEEVEKLSSLISVYNGPQDAEQCRTILSTCRDWRKDELSREQAENRMLLHNLQQQIAQADEILKKLRQTTEAVPERSEKVQAARRILRDNNIDFQPFYEAVEFAEGVDAARQAQLEMQLSDAGILDALVVADADRDRAEHLLCDLSDCLINGNLTTSGFMIAEIVPAETSSSVGQAVQGILQQIGTTDDTAGVLSLNADGYYRHGLLIGHSIADEQVRYLGRKARQEALRRQIAEQEKLRDDLVSQAGERQEKLAALAASVQLLNEEYAKLPTFADLDQGIDMVSKEDYKYKQLCHTVSNQEKIAEAIKQRKLDTDRKVVAVCKLLPYSRTAETYEVVAQAVNEYDRELRLVNHQVTVWETKHIQQLNETEKRQANELFRDDLSDQLKKQGQTLQLLQAEIAELQRLVDSPENIEKKKRYGEISRRLRTISLTGQGNLVRLAELRILIDDSMGKIEDKSTALAAAYKKRQAAQEYFAEDLRITKPPVGGEYSLEALVALAPALVILPETQESKDLQAVVGSLLKVYQTQSGSLNDYGIALEDYFGDDTSGYGLLRRRTRIAFTWRGKKLYLHEFHEVLTNAITDLELLIKKQDRELFEKILGNTLSRKLSNRIADSKQWIGNMSQLMMQMDTSMGLNFSLSWKPCHREGPEELEVTELEKLLSRDTSVLTQEDIDKVAIHFRSRIDREKQIIVERGESPNYTDLVRDALDYRKWYEFKMYYHRADEPRKELTNSAFNKYSGGEKAMAMYVPLFAAVNAQYLKSDNKEHPRIIALDEAFAGVDDKNISSMFDLVQQLDFDYIMNSQALWGCYAAVSKLRIAELYRPANSDDVSVINYEWNGKERKLV